MADLTPYQRDILTKTILSEARGEGDTGMAAVAWNILNRANSGKYPSDPAKVALQPKQYSGWNKGEGGNNPSQFKPGTSQYERAAQIVDAVATGQIPDMTGGALQYHASNIKPYWADEANRNGQLKVGNHVFYPTHPVPPGDIPSVATLLDTKRPAVAPNPASQSPVMAALRNARPSASDMTRGKSPMNTITSGSRAPIGMVAPGNLDLNARKVFNGPDGDFRTENSMSIGTDQGEVLIPTVVNGRQLTQDQAIAHYERTGENLGTFRTPQAADRYAEALHQRQAVRYEPPSVALPRARPETAAPDLISRSMASLPRKTSNLGDSLAMAPIQGGRQTVAPFDAAFDTRTGQMRMTKEPYAGFGNDVATSKAPAPTPASVDDRINARNLSQQRPTGMAALSRAPITYAAQDSNVMRRAPTPASVDDRLNARNLAQQQALLPEIPAAAPVAPVSAPAVAQAAILPSAMTASDRARAAQVGIKPVPERLPSEPMMGARASAPPAQPGPWSVATLTDTVNPLTGLRTTAPAAAPVMARAAPNPLSRPAAAPVMRSPIAQVQPTFGRAPLQINVSGANIMRAPSVVGTSTGRLYTPGATVMLNGDRLTVNPNGSFTNERTGNELRGSSSGGRSLVETADGMQWR